MSSLMAFTRSFKQISQNGSAIRSTWSPLLVNAVSTRGHHGHEQAAMTDTVPNHKFYELRTYKIKPAKFAEFLGLTKEHMHIRLGHSKLIGYWTPDIGGLNEVFHIWEYDCFAARSAVRAALAKDENWNSVYFSKVLPMFDQQENVAAKLLPWKPLQEKPFQEGGIYELRQYALNPGLLNAMKAPLMVRDEAYNNVECGKLMGVFFGNIGHCNTIYMLWNFISADKREEARQAVLKTEAFKKLPPNPALTSDMRSKIMVPLPFSPLN